MLKLDHNRIGPGAGKDIGLLKKSLKILTISHNRMGDFIRYPTLFQRQRIFSAARDIFAGVRYNKTLQMLDLAYNNLGPSLADVFPSAINRHPKLFSLNIAGNQKGGIKGPTMLFSLAGEYNGEKRKIAREKHYKLLRNKTMAAINDSDANVIEDALNDDSASNDEEVALISAMQKEDKMNNEETCKNLPVLLIQDQNIADNQLGSMAGHAIAALLLKSKSITALDVSNNSLGFAGGTDALVKCYEMIPKDFFKRLLRKIENSKYEGRYAKKRSRFTQT